jgi:hypothetical protein
MLEWFDGVQFCINDTLCTLLVNFIGVYRKQGDLVA